MNQTFCVFELALSLNKAACNRFLGSLQVEVDF